MNKYEMLSLTFCVVGCVAVFLPTAFAGGFNCYGCSSDPLVSPSQCNMSTVSVLCNDDSSGTGRCYAATAELMNGTIIGFKGCFHENANCNNVRACDRAQNVTGASFKRCVAECCDTHKCNQYLHQVLPSISVPATPTATATATASVSVNTTHAPTTKAPKERPSAAGIKIKAFCYLPIVLLVVIQMMI
ncbi:hypothetical protein OS493_032446 [Desmophyllum pertusum]|uniref:Sodefrin-like factor n=1 Tax=Desmophyllum pertusum TaxID=174260 RepID=A0A9W9ZYC8_9CNID|nr:hypothetical protein OS493_032446 [Desmophyllum pertusum]